MSLKIIGSNFDVTVVVESHITEKLGRISRHAPNVTSVAITLSVEKVNHKVGADIHLAGKDLHVEIVEADMYAVVNVLTSKIDRAVLKYKEKSNDVRNTVKPAAG